MDKKDSVLKYISCECVHEDAEGKIYCDSPKSPLCLMCLVAQQQYNDSLNKKKNDTERKEYC